MFIEGAIPEKLVEEAVGTRLQGSGAQTVFIGRVRPDEVHNSQVESIEFSAHRELAEITAREIIEESLRNFDILGAEVWHSLGKVLKGQACFLVTVSGKHRKPSFQALEYIVDEVKKRCPIFGKEQLSDGKILWKENKA